MKNRRIHAVLLGGLLWVCLPVQALPLPANGAWQEFQFGVAGSPWSTEPDGAPISFDFVLLNPTFLQVTDAGLSGDRFAVIVNGGARRLTSVPGDGGDISLDFDAAFVDSRWSSGSFLLSGGSYSVTGFAIDSPFDAGIGGVRLQQIQQIDEPAAVSLLLIGLGIAGGVSRFRRTTSSAKDLT